MPASFFLTAMNTRELLDLLREIEDPELGCNIVDLGLIYDLKIAGASISITMTMTTPGCPMQEAITQGVQSLLKRLPEIDHVHIDLVWSPAWNPSMMNRPAG